MSFQTWYRTDFDGMTITPVELEPGEGMVRTRVEWHRWQPMRTRTRVYASTEAEGRQEMARFIRRKIERCEVVISNQHGMIAKERGMIADYARRLGEFEAAPTVVPRSVAMWPTDANGAPL